MTELGRRISARVLPVSPDGACLLLHELDPQHPDEPYWASVGGGVDPGEPLRIAAVRELHEETGVRAEPEALIGPVARVVEPFSWNGVAHLGDARYFALPLDRSVATSLAHLEPEEVGTVLGARWWRPDDVADLACRPSALPDLMRAAIARVTEVGGQPPNREAVVNRVIRERP